MSSILKVDTIQDQAGNNIISEAANVITIGASGDTITVPAGAIVSGFTSAGIDDNATSTAMTITSAERVGINVTSPGGLLHVQSASSGASVNAGGDEVIVENSSDAGISILSGTSSKGQLILTLNNRVDNKNLPC